MEVGYLQRKAARALNYGVGKLTLTVKIDGLTLVVSSLYGSTTFVVDGSEQRLTPPQGGNVMGTVLLVGSVIEIRVPAMQLVMRRWIEMDEMLATIDFKGVSTTRSFTKVV